MKRLLFATLYAGLSLVIISLITAKIYLLGLSELLAIPSCIALVIINFKNAK